MFSSDTSAETPGSLPSQVRSCPSLASPLQDPKPTSVCQNPPLSREKERLEIACASPRRRRQLRNTTRRPCEATAGAKSARRARPGPEPSKKITQLQGTRVVLRGEKSTIPTMPSSDIFFPPRGCSERPLAQPQIQLIKEMPKRKNLPPTFHLFGQRDPLQTARALAAAPDRSPKKVYAFLGPSRRRSSQPPTTAARRGNSSIKV